MNMIDKIKASLNAALTEIGVAQHWAENLPEPNEGAAVFSNLHAIRQQICTLLENIEDHL